jgi:hypothetical protein
MTEPNRKGPPKLHITCRRVPYGPRRGVIEADGTQFKIGDEQRLAVAERRTAFTWPLGNQLRVDHGRVARAGRQAVVSGCPARALDSQSTLAAAMTPAYTPLEGGCRRPPLPGSQRLASRSRCSHDEGPCCRAPAPSAWSQPFAACLHNSPAEPAGLLIFTRSVCDPQSWMCVEGIF